MQVRCQAYSALAHLVPATAAAFPASPDGAHVVDTCGALYAHMLGQVSHNTPAQGPVASRSCTAAGVGKPFHGSHPTGRLLC